MAQTGLVAKPGFRIKERFASWIGLLTFLAFVGTTPANAQSVQSGSLTNIEALRVILEAPINCKQAQEIPISVTVSNTSDAIVRVMCKDFNGAMHVILHAENASGVPATEPEYTITTRQPHPLVEHVFPAHSIKVAHRTIPTISSNHQPWPTGDYRIDASIADVRYLHEKPSVNLVKAIPITIKLQK